MLKAFLLYLADHPGMAELVRRNRLLRGMVRRFVAGETLDEAVETVQRLNQAGLAATLDFLGESITSLDEARQSARQYMLLLEQIKTNRLNSHISVKLTQLGLDLDSSLCQQLMDEITDYAAGIGVFVRVDMEDSAHTERTLNMVRKLSERHENVGVAIQAYLYRSEDDINELNSRRISVRLCKGAYREPAALAFPRKQDTDANYCYLTTLLLNEGRRPAFATHDQRIITWILDYARRHQVAAKSFEFQMLHGIRRDLQEQLAGDGNQVRIYVPYGTHWYPYLTRRMAERPANLLFILTQFFRG